MALLLVALALRIYNLAGQSLWYDEGVSAQVSAQGLSELTRWTADDIQPPLYYYVEFGWTHLAGRGEWQLRFPSTWFSLLTLPLLYAAGRKLWDQPAGLLAAGFAAVYPLYLWYAQEARMYTMLTALGLAATCFLLQAAAHPNQRWAWLGFVLTSVAALYTHYFAAFLLMALAIAWIASPAARRGRALRNGVIAAVLICLAYLPWLPFVLNRYRLDASYWAGQLKLDEAIRHIFLSFAAGETMQEVDARRWLPAVALVVGLAAGGLLYARFKGRQRGAAHSAQGGLDSLTLLAYYGLLPLVLVLILSYRTPKFNPRYLMLATPAWLLLTAGGLSEVGRAARAEVTHLPGPRLALFALRAAPVVGTLILAGLWGTADRNLYLDGSFTKSEFRRAARYVTDWWRPDETVILLSGHMAPVWDYYRPNGPDVRIPDIDILDTSRIVDYSVAGQLNRALAGKGGVWVVQWQDEVVDPNGLVIELLQRAAGQEPMDAGFVRTETERLHPPPGQFARVVLTHFRLQPGQSFTFSDQPPIQHATDLIFGGQIQLLGWSQDTVNGQDDLMLFWKALHPLDQVYKVQLTLRTSDGTVVANIPDRRLGAYEYPSDRWPAGHVVFGRISLRELTGQAAGDYRLGVIVYAESDPQVRALPVSGTGVPGEQQVAVLNPLHLSGQ